MIKHLLCVQLCELDKDESALQKYNIVGHTHTHNHLMVQTRSRENNFSDSLKDKFVLFCSIIFGIRYVDNFIKNHNLPLCLGHSVGQEEVSPV